MPRGNGHGGVRQGTPGKGYANRTDLAVKPDMSQNTAATGGMEAPVQEQNFPTPDDSPNLTDPTQFPDEPITAGLPMGAGPGPNRDNRHEETKQLKRYLPVLGMYLDNPETPDSVRSLYRYIRGA